MDAEKYLNIVITFYGRRYKRDFNNELQRLKQAGHNMTKVTLQIENFNDLSASGVANIKPLNIIVEMGAILFTNQLWLVLITLFIFCFF